jgi:hypothetical protein
MTLNGAASSSSTSITDEGVYSQAQSTTLSQSQTVSCP